MGRAVGRKARVRSTATGPSWALEASRAHSLEQTGVRVPSIGGRGRQFLTAWPGLPAPQRPTSRAALPLARRAFSPLP